MTGLFLIFIAFVWIVIALFLALIVASKIPRKVGGSWNVIWIFSLLLPAPLIDEIVGKRQFERLCKENSTIQIDRTKSKGRTVYLAETTNTSVPGTWMPITIQHWQYLDAATDEVVVSYNTLTAQRVFGITESKMPLTFDGYCAPNGSRRYANDLMSELGITQIERSKLNNKREQK